MSEMVRRVWTERQPRERACPCSRCGQDTWAITAVCDRCTKKQARP